jgi:hypothetical protein
VAGKCLSCGCLVGVYETYQGAVVATIDAQGRSCQDSSHRLHASVPVTPEHLLLDSPPQSGVATPR